MDRSAGHFLRWVRAALVAAVALVAGTVAHVSAGGLMPGPVALGLVLMGCTVGAAWVLGRPASTARVAFLLLTAQTAVHGVLTALAGHRGDHPTPTATPKLPPELATGGTIGTRGTGSAYDQLYGAGLPAGGGQPVELSVPAPVQHLIADMAGPNAVMALAHLVAAALVGLWLAAGERALWTVLALADDRVRWFVRGAVNKIVAASAAFVLRLRVLGQVLTVSSAGLAALRATCPIDDPAIGRSLLRRGPPALLAA